MGFEYEKGRSRGAGAPPPPPPYEPTPEQRRAHARQVADNLDDAAKHAAQEIEAVTRAAMVGDHVAWAAARASLDRAIASFEGYAKATTEHVDHADDETRPRLEGASERLAALQREASAVPAQPERAERLPSCAAALLAALPPLDVGTESREVVFGQAFAATNQVIRSEMTYTDIGLFRALVNESPPTHPIGQRFARFAGERRNELMALLADSKFKAHAKAVENARAAAMRAAAAAGVAAPAARAEVATPGGAASPTTIDTAPLDGGAPARDVDGTGGTGGIDGDEGAPLPAPARARFEATAGASLDGARVRDDDEAHALAAAHDARAVTVGQTIHLGAGEDVSTPDGERLLAHEAAHALQHRGAGGTHAAAAKPLQATAPTEPAELEADRFADAAAAGRPHAIGETLGDDVAALDRRRRSERARDRQDAADLAREPDGENAYMTVRAYDARGALVDLWTGPAYFHGALPAEYVAQKKRGSWRWTRNGQADPDGARLKVDSDAQGEAGVPVGRWAPDDAAQVTVSLHGLSDPFERHVVVAADGPLTMIGRLTEQSADGAEPIDLDAPGRVTGPLVPGAIVQSGDLVIEQHARGTTFTLGGSVLHVGAADLADYAFTVHAQTSPRQRAIDLVGTPTVTAELHNDPSSPQLAYHLARVEPGKVPAPEGDAGVSAPVLPSIVVIGDTVRCDLLLDADRIHIEAVQPGARFAYWIDPEWSGEHGEARAVHVVATPGVVVDSLSGPGAGRKLIANPIYVQDPARVPKQGTPIEPADYLGAESLQYGGAERDAATVYTGAAGVTVRDHDLGVFVSIEVADPAAGGRFAWALDRDPAAPAFRALVGPGVRVHVHEVTEPGPLRPPTVPYQDFGVAIDLRQTDDAAQIPPQGEPLPAGLLAGFPARAPDSRSYQDPLTTAERVAEVAGKMAVDLAVGFSPGIGDAADLAEAVAGIDKWGNRLSDAERVVAGVAAVLPFVSGAALAVGRHVRQAMKLDGALAELAARIGKTAPEMEAMLASLRRLDDDARAAARRVEEAIRIGGDVDAEDLATVDRALRAIGFGGLPEVRGGLRLAGNADDAPRVRAPEGATPEDYERLGRVADDAPRDPRDQAKLAERTDETAALAGVVERRYRALSGGKKAPPFRVEVLTERAFAERFASEKGRAVFVVEGDEAVIYARTGASAGEMADEAAHLAQLADPQRAADLRFVSEGNLAGWADKSVSDKLEFYDRKLAVEIDAKRRTLAAVDDPIERAAVGDQLADLERLQAELAAIDPGDLALMNAGVKAPPFDLDQPSRMFAKVREVGVANTRRPDPGDPATLKTSSVSRDRAAPDYSTAYGDRDVEAVEQIGDAWKEQIIVTSGYEGKVAAIEIGADGVTVVVETGGGRRVAYGLEPGATLDPAIAVGEPVRHGQTLAREEARDYRLVRGRRRDGTTFEREEIRSAKKGQGWVLRGSEATRRGEQAEAAARADVDAELAQKVKDGAITGSARLPGNLGGGGFDDVVVEFTGAGDAVEATIRIREVKNYPNRHVPLGDFTAITTNYEKNLDELRGKVDKAVEALSAGKTAESPFAGLSLAQLEAIQKKLEDADVHVEVVLASGTKLGAEGHHAARTLPALRAQHPNLSVTSMDNLETS